MNLRTAAQVMLMSGFAVTAYAQVEVTGLVEVELGASSTDTENTSDINVATVEVGLGAELSENASAQVVLLYEENDTPIEVDVAILTFDLPGSAFTFTLGQDYLPFGQYHTALVSDPLSLEIGETRETSVVLLYEQDLIHGAVYVFNGDQDQDGKDQVNNFGVRFGVASNQMAFGLDYASNIADSDGLQDRNFGYAAGADPVAGASVYGLVQFGEVTVSAEHLTVLDPLLVDGAGTEPAASNVELSLMSGDYTVGLAFETTDEAAFLELPENRIRLGMAKTLFEGTSLGIELSQDDDYAVADGGTGGDSTNFVVQLAAEF